jgi:hypothetical protein
MPELCLLTNTKTNTTFIIPDAVYTGGENKTVEFNSIFGNNKTKEYNNSCEYFYFYKSFGDAVKEGGWIHNKDSINNSSGRLIVENDYGMYIKGGINRYALFIEGQIYIETQRDFQLSDECINEMYPEPSIIICYSNVYEHKRDILVKKYESFASLSFHQLNKDLLDDRYIYTNKNKYMIM